MDETNEQNTNHVVYNPKMFRTTRKLKQNVRITFHRNGFQS